MIGVLICLSARNETVGMSERSRCQSTAGHLFRWMLELVPSWCCFKQLKLRRKRSSSISIPTAIKALNLLICWWSLLCLCKNFSFALMCTFSAVYWVRGTFSWVLSSHSLFVCLDSCDVVIHYVSPAGGPVFWRETEYLSHWIRDSGLWVKS